MKKYQQKIWTTEEWFYECKKRNFEISLIGNFHYLKTACVVYLLKDYNISEQEISFVFKPASKFTQFKRKARSRLEYDFFGNPDYNFYSLHEIRIKRPLDTKIFFDPDDNLYSLKIENYSELEYLGYSSKNNKDDSNKVIAHGLYYDTELSLSFNM